MEKVYPMMQSPMNMPLPNVAPAAVSPAAVQPPMYGAPINVHASYEEINIYAPKKHDHHHHHHMPAAVAHSCAAPRLNAGAILVLYILLVIILRSFPRY
ncbi:hypothetical protein [Paenibacillus puerhi]|uniref:hypothetical protein n=1 Tax=Paenibacillus puerhi TaxID=2692622 RepID=UPI00135CBBC5|nr:hypothetical protein [Paenibacillus puerhi]